MLIALQMQSLEANGHKQSSKKVSQTEVKAESTQKTNASKELNKKPKKKIYVYICTGRYARVFHATNYCKGLSRCRGEIKEITLKQARYIGRRACRICYD